MLVLRLMKTNTLLILGVLGIALGFVLSPEQILVLALVVLIPALVVDIATKAPSFAFLLGSAIIVGACVTPAWIISSIIR